MFSTTISGALQGVNGMLLQVEVDASNGMPCLEMVGLLGSEVREAGERVRAVIKNLGISLPPKRILVNLSPANVKKVGTAYDLPIAIGILKSLEILPNNATEGVILLGELGLDGTIKPVKGVLPILSEAAKKDIKCCIVAEENEREAKFLKNIKVYSFGNIKEVVDFLKKEPSKRDRGTASVVKMAVPERDESADVLPFAKAEGEFEQIKGQVSGKRAALIAIAGEHNFLLVGPPGTGKTMIIKALPSILPPLSEEEALEVASVLSATGRFLPRDLSLIKRPFVEVHHSATVASLIGGGVLPKPGAMTGAHRGILFLDELPEFKRMVLDAMRQPLEEKNITLIRSGYAYHFPAKSLLVAAMNPCPCGYYPDKNKCTCSQRQVRNYISHISGPILDRMDIVAETTSLKEGYGDNYESKKYTGAYMAGQVLSARKMQEERYAAVFPGKGEPLQTTREFLNGNLSGEEILKSCFLDKPAEVLLQKLSDKYCLSGRAYYSLLKVARTIADLEECEKVTSEHLAEAAGYRLGFERYFYG